MSKNKILEMRMARQWSQPVLAEKSRCHWVTISKLERGKIQLTQKWMDRLAMAFGVKPGDLLPDAPAPSQPPQMVALNLSDLVQLFAMIHARHAQQNVLLWPRRHSSDRERAMRFRQKAKPAEAAQ